MALTTVSTFVAGGVRSGLRTRLEPVAQSVEQLTFNQRVAGSIPAGLTNSYLSSPFVESAGTVSSSSTSITG